MSKSMENLAGLFTGKMKGLRDKPNETSGASARDRAKAEREEIEKIDRRSERKTGRTEQFAVRIKLETKTEIYAYAKTHTMTVGETIERAMAALQKEITEARKDRE